MENPTPKIAIIGGGLAGLALTLALHQHGIASSIFEARPQPLNIGGAIMLSPNALKVLDKLEIYEEVRKEGYEFKNLTWQTIDGSSSEKEEFGGKEKYGYDVLRVHRYVLIDAFVKSLQRVGVAIHFGRKFIGATEDRDGVEVSFADGTTERFGLLIGADGIHSAVRRLLYPDLVPKFIGLAGVTAAIPTSTLDIPEDTLQNLENPALEHPLPITIQHPSYGAFAIAPQRAGAKEMFIGRQRRWSDTGRAGWDARSVDKSELATFLAWNTDGYPQIVQDLVRSIPHDTINLWPFYVIPNLPSWISAKSEGRIILVGDAAHSIPPSAGQGVNQAFEDVYTLALTMKDLDGGLAEPEVLSSRLKKWQEWRLERVKGILELNGMIEARRLPVNDRSPAQSLLADKRMELGWLFGVDFEKDVAMWN